MMNPYPIMYAALGRLFYSVAFCDKTIRDVEVETMLGHVDKNWLQFKHPNDKHGTQSAHYIGFGFETSVDQNMDERSAFDKFKEHYQENNDLYTEAIKELVVRTSMDMASSFKGNNKAELSRLAQIQQLLGKQLITK